MAHSVKIIAFLIVVFGLVTAAYSTAVVVPKYSQVNSEWTRSSSASSSYSLGSSSANASLQEKRTELRSRSQSYAFAAAACAVVGVGVGVIGRKKPGGIPFGVSLALGVITLVLVGVMQSIGNIF
jgi:hypothetical protein